MALLHEVLKHPTVSASTLSSDHGARLARKEAHNSILVYWYTNMDCKININVSNLYFMFLCSIILVHIYLFNYFIAVVLRLKYKKPTNWIFVKWLVSFENISNLGEMSVVEFVIWDDNVFQWRSLVWKCVSLWFPVWVTQLTWPYDSFWWCHASYWGHVINVTNMSNPGDAWT